MELNWNELSPTEKRQARLKKWLAAETINFPSAEAKAAYQVRLKRFIDAINLSEPDRVPCILPAGYFPAYNYGIDTYTAMYDFDLAAQAWIKFMHEFESDSASGMVINSGILNEILGLKTSKWPGHGLPKDATMHQFVEDEYMKPEEYNLVIKDPSDFCLRYYIPRCVGAFEGFSKLMPFRNIMGMATSFLSSCMNPDVQAAFQSIQEATREMGKNIAASTRVSKEAIALGLPSFSSGTYAHAPFDIFADTLRGTRGITMDMYRQPDKLLEAMDSIIPWILENAFTAAKRSSNPLVFFALHKGDDHFMSDQQFAKFYWPQFRQVIMGFVNEGFIPLLFAEGSYNRRLDIIQDLPPGSVIWWFDRTDIFKAKDILGKSACIMGNVPTSLMCTCTPEAVREYCRKLIEYCGKGGGYILAGGASVDKADPRNFHMLMQAAKEFGVYAR
jgi:uroporphyrinogen-III decarboxylase